MWMDTDTHAMHTHCTSCHLVRPNLQLIKLTPLPCELFLKDETLVYTPMNIEFAINVFRYSNPTKYIISHAHSLNTYFPVQLYNYKENLLQDQNTHRNIMFKDTAIYTHVVQTTDV